MTWNDMKTAPKDGTGMSFERPEGKIVVGDKQ